MYFYFKSCTMNSSEASPPTLTNTLLAERFKIQYDMIIIIIMLSLLISRLLIVLLFWFTKLANVLETSGRLSFYFSAFLFCCSDSTAFCFTMRLFMRTVRSNSHSYNFLSQFFPNPPGPLIPRVNNNNNCIYLYFIDKRQQNNKQ